MAFLSIIVPIYNVEEYLPQCIESVLAQPFTDYELILVDDGSPDNCGNICDDYAKIDRRIRVIHQDNAGLSGARNSGINIARGEYILFLDGDDYMKDSTLEGVIGLLQDNHDVDILICPILHTYSDGEIEMSYSPIHEGQFAIMSQEDLFNAMMLSRAIFWGAGKNVYKKSHIEENDVYFQRDLIGAEDCDFFMKFVQYSKKVLFTNIPLVHYRMGRAGSITTDMSKEAILGQLQVFERYYRIYKNNTELCNPDLSVFFANKFASAVSLLGTAESGTDLTEVLSFVEETRDVLKDARGIKYSIARLIWSICGIHKGSSLLWQMRSILPK
jgi:glycosyltransferase involved in cell wall biosynthesis